MDSFYLHVTLGGSECEVVIVWLLSGLRELHFTSVSQILVKMNAAC